MGLSGQKQKEGLPSICQLTRMGHMGGAAPGGGMDRGAAREPVHRGEIRATTGPLLVVMTTFVISFVGWTASDTHGGCNLIPVAEQQFGSNVGGVTSHALARCGVVVAERISCARVLSLRVVVQVNSAGSALEADVFQDRAEATGGMVNLRFGLRRKANHLGVAAALKVEHTLVAPAVFIIADKRAGGVR